MTFVIASAKIAGFLSKNCHSKRILLAQVLRRTADIATSDSIYVPNDRDSKTGTDGWQSD
jgi:hypothetical protein